MPLRTEHDKAKEDFRKDQVSHFILRLAYCKTEDLRRKFLQFECTLFKFRLEKLSDAQRREFMAQNGLSYEQVSDKERTERQEKLAGLAGVAELKIFSTTFYKVPFQQALQLISSRSVYLEHGFAYVPLQRLVSIILMRFRMNLSRALVEAANMFEHVSSDTRIGPLLKNMNEIYAGKQYNSNTAVDKLTPQAVDGAAENNMPLCMKNLHVSLKRDKKLKHWGRLQYGLFLKGAGLELEDALIFWESHFSKMMTHEEFTKGYAYSFRHMYGKEGARKNYTPYSCMKIIMGTPPEAGAFHGCPYRHATDQQLTAMLGSLKIGGNDVKEIVQKAKVEGHYQIACQRHFEVTHPDWWKNGVTGNVAEHPNQWFQASVTYHKSIAGVTTDKPASGSTAPVVSPGSSSEQSAEAGKAAEAAAAAAEASQGAGMEVEA
jgi:DNA primase large subunit